MPAGIIRSVDPHYYDAPRRSGRHDGRVGQVGEAVVSSSLGREEDGDGAVPRVPPTRGGLPQEEAPFP
ncbi:hypothetical protein AB0F88_42200 [Streptosporangium sp. NPDC023963]|uniref:hypothetical protein n=1 Tax=Streptosporangium sp. NPDC023963 TaxID=3155608 RepID=UPI003438B0B9